MKLSSMRTCTCVDVAIQEHQIGDERSNMNFYILRMWPETNGEKKELRTSNEVAFCPCDIQSIDRIWGHVGS